MTKIPRAIYSTSAQIDALIAEREKDAASLPPGQSRQTIMREIARLRMYADAKRWVDSPELKPANPHPFRFTGGKSPRR